MFIVASATRPWNCTQRILRVFAAKRSIEMLTGKAES
jgi:hypothetical protein